MTTEVKEPEQIVDEITGEIIEQEPPDISQESFRANVRRVREADTAEPFEIVGKLIETGWERVHLFSADYWFQTHTFQKCGITRKTTDDLLQSIFLGEDKAKTLGKHSFKMQLSEMLDYFDFCKILIEGNWNTIMSDDHTRNAVQNFLSRWQDKGYGIILSSSNAMTVKILNEQYALYQKPYSLVAKTKGFTDDRVLAFPEGTRGKTAEDCLSIFGSLSNVALANESELRSVPKLGPKKVALIMEHFNKDNDKNLWKYSVRKVYESVDKNANQGSML
jgi:ERCC4-type nuclease